MKEREKNDATMIRYINRKGGLDVLTIVDGLNVSVYS